MKMNNTTYSNVEHQIILECSKIIIPFENEEMVIDVAIRTLNTLNAANNYVRLGMFVYKQNKLIFNFSHEDWEINFKKLLKEIQKEIFLKKLEMLQN